MRLDALLKAIILGVFLFWVNKMCGILFLLIISIVVLFEKYKFDSSMYKFESGNSFFKTIFDLGLCGEYYTFAYLEKICENPKILTNVYIEKENGETSEIDVIFLHDKGVFVLESKNYSGWIYGNEKSKNWTVTYNSRYKKKFYNPIKQNKTHIKYVSQFLNIDREHVQSIIVFSERCILKKVPKEHDNVHVINRYKLKRLIKRLIKESNVDFTEEQVNDMYFKLEGRSRVSEEEKERHIKEIKSHIDAKGNYR